MNKKEARLSNVARTVTDLRRVLLITIATWMATDFSDACGGGVGSGIVNVEANAVFKDGDKRVAISDDARLAAQPDIAGPIVGATEVNGINNCVPCGTNTPCCQCLPGGTFTLTLGGDPDCPYACRNGQLYYACNGGQETGIPCTGPTNNPATSCVYTNGFYGRFQCCAGTLVAAGPGDASSNGCAAGIIGCGGGGGGTNPSSGAITDAQTGGTSGPSGCGLCGGSGDSRVVVGNSVIITEAWQSGATGKPVACPPDLACNASAPCRWGNDDKRVTHGTYYKATTKSLRVNVLESLFGSRVLPVSPVILSIAPHNSPGRFFVSDPINRASSKARLHFKMWNTFGVRLKVCVREVNARTLLNCTPSFIRTAVEPASPNRTVQIGPIDKPFQLVFWNGGYTSIIGGIGMLDDIAYFDPCLCGSCELRMKANAAVSLEPDNEQLLEPLPTKGGHENPSQTTVCERFAPTRRRQEHRHVKRDARKHRVYSNQSHWTCSNRTTSTKIKTG